MFLLTCLVLKFPFQRIEIIVCRRLLFSLCQKDYVYSQKFTFSKRASNLSHRIFWSLLKKTMTWIVAVCGSLFPTSICLLLRNLIFIGSKTKKLQVVFLKQPLIPKCWCLPSGMVSKNWTFENLKNFSIGERNLLTGSEIMLKLHLKNLLFQRYGQSINEKILTSNLLTNLKYQKKLI